MRKGLLLIELLTIIAILAILAGILFPIYQETVRRHRLRHNPVISVQK